MIFSHPYSRYGLALILLRENLDKVEDITTEILMKYLEEGLSHFRFRSDSNPEIDEYLLYSYIPMQTIINTQLKGNPSKGIYLCPNIITSDIKASNTWITINSIFNKLGQNPDYINNIEKLTMGIAPIAGEINNGTKSKKNATGTVLEAGCCAITSTTPFKPYLAYREKGGKYTPTAIIPDLEINEMKTFIQLYILMLNTLLEGNKLLSKKVYRKEDIKPKFSRPLIYNGNFPFAPQNSAFGIVGLLGAIGRWSKEANYIILGQQVLDSLKYKPIYLIQYGKALSVTIHHYIIDLAKENKLSEIVYSIQNSKLINPFDEKDPKDNKGVESRKDIFYLFSSRFLQLFNKPAFNDFLSIRAEYSDKLIELFNIFFEKEMSIRKEVVHSVKALGLWLNYVAFKVGKQVALEQKKTEKIRDFKAKVLIELESSVFGARKPAEILNVIVRAGRLSGTDAPAESDIFQEAVLTEEISINDAKSMLMAFARIRNRFEASTNDENLSEEKNSEDFFDSDIYNDNTK
jgi:hypothetical protein